MPGPISAFGTDGPTRMTITLETTDDANDELRAVPRAVWFDRDAVSGHWLIWVRDPDEYGPSDGDIGAIVVRDATVGAFLDALGRLLMTPADFADEPVFDASRP